MENKFNDDLRVLVYGDVSKLEKLMDRHFLGQLTSVSDEITQKPDTIEQLNKYVREGGFTHVLIPDEHFHKLKGSLEGCFVPVVEFLGDHWVSWAVKRKKEYMENNGIDHAIVFSSRFQEPYKELVNMHTVLCGYNNLVFKDRSMERDIDILIHGSLGEDTYGWVYPVRNWLDDILPNIGEKEGLKIGFHNHPGYEDKEKSGGEHEREYADVLNRSKIAIGGSSYWRLPLKKFYEVAACGTILLSDLPLEDRDFFKNRIIEVDSNKIHTKKYEDDIRKNIVNTLENYGESKEILQPFRTEKDIFDKSYKGRALEIRAILSTI